MHPDVINVEDMKQVDQPVRYCIVIDEDDDLELVPANEADPAKTIGTDTFLGKRDAEQRLRIIEAVANDLMPADRKRAAAWLIENKLLA